MKKHIVKRSCSVVALLIMTMSLYAQSSVSSYFLEGYSKRNQLNPAFAPERRVFISLPGLSNTQFDLQSTFGLSNFLYESTSKPGMLTTFMSPDVNAQDFLDGLPDVSQLRVGMNMDIFAFGIGGQKWFTELNVKLRNNEKIGLPKDLFGFMKAGLSTGDYLIEDLNVNSTTYLEYALTHSQKINSNLTVGAAFKLLQGVAYVDLNLDEIDAKLGEQQWQVKSNGALLVSAPGLGFKTNAENGTFDGIGDYEFEMPSSFGLALDLGAEYDFKDLVKGLKVSAAISDLGFINWKSVTKFATNNNEYVTFDGFNGYDVMSKDNDAVTEKIGDDFKDMIKLYKDDATDSKSVALGATFRMGAEYEMPFAKWLSFGELLVYRTGVLEYFESRTSICMSPLSWLDLTGNVGVSTLGTAMGLMLNLHPGGINFFLAVDNLSAELNKQFVPLNDFGVNVSFGLNLAVGGKR